jgi:hypothetical protein
MDALLFMNWKKLLGGHCLLQIILPARQCNLKGGLKQAAIQRRE